MTARAPQANAAAPRRGLLVGLLSLPLVGVPSARALAQPATTAASTAGALGPEVEAALRRMSATLAAAPAFAFRMQTVREAALPDGQRVLLGATAAVLARRPNQLVVQVGSDLGNLALWAEGGRVTLFNPGANLFGITSVPGDLAAIVDWLEARMGVEMSVRPLLAADPYGAMMEAGSTSGRQLGTSLVGDAPAEHFAFRNPALDWEVWIEATPRALPLRVSLVHRSPDGPLRTTMTFEEWNLAPQVTEEMFRFVAPAGAVEATLQPLGGDATPRRTP